MPSRQSRSAPAKKINQHQWLFEPLEDQPTFTKRRMFGALAGYFNGLLVLVLADRDEPWRGVLVPTERDAHAALIAEFPALAPHPVLGKWLYLPEGAPTFEHDAQKLITRIRHLDPRIGVQPDRKRPAKKGGVSNQLRPSAGPIENARPHSWSFDS